MRHWTGKKSAGSHNYHDGISIGMTGLRTIDQRYYASTSGRFNSPDSIGAQAGDPVSWNRYSYTGGDPVNRLDPHGTDWIYSGSLGWCSTLNLDGWCSNGGGSGCSGISPDAMLSLVLSGDAAECGWGGGTSYSGTVYEQPPQQQGGDDGGGGGTPPAPATCQSEDPISASYGADETGELDVLFGEDSWNLGYGASGVTQEDEMMINVMVNQTIQTRGADSQSGVTAFLAKYGGRFAGLTLGTAAYQSALASPHLAALASMSKPHRLRSMNSGWQADTLLLCTMPGVQMARYPLRAK